MTFLPARKLTQEVMLGQIEQVLRRGPETDVPAYTLILGAGASYGSVPTARQMLGLPEKGVIHPQSIPLYLHELDTGAAPAENERAGVVADFWRRFLEANPDLLREGTMEGQAQMAVKLKGGLPDSDSIPNAYQNIFSQQRTGGLNTPSDAREYIRRLTLPKGQQTRLNGTHFYLASLLSLQDQRARAGEPSAYVGKRPFARTIFTTNFDPLLQVSLQLFQLLYYMTDRPDQLAADALHTDGHPAVHLFYAHGSVHRPFLANTDSEIGSLHPNAPGLAGYLSQHGVIVLGYAGWDDCLLQGLKQTPTFANNLYWLARGEASLTEDVKKFLSSHPNAHWVEISDGGQWMAALHQRLCPRLPNTELLKNPLPFLRRRIEQVDLTNIETEPRKVRLESQDGIDLPASIHASDRRTSPEEFRGQVIDLLTDFEQMFEQRSAAIDVRIQLKRLEHSADMAYGEEHWAKAHDLYSAIVSEPNATAAQKAKALLRRASSSESMAAFDAALADYSSVIEMVGTPIEHLAAALFRRGKAYWQEKKAEAALADCTRLIGMAGVPTKLTAWALVIRAFIHAAQGKSAEALADYTRVIELPGVPNDVAGLALARRGTSYGADGQSEAAYADYARAMELPGVPAEFVAGLLVDRGLLHQTQGKSEAALVDWTHVIDLSVPDVPTDFVAKALYFRGLANGMMQGTFEEALTDWTRVIEMPGAPTETVAQALLGRGVLHASEGNLESALADYTRVIELPGIATVRVTGALLERGALYMAQGNSAAALVDWTRVIEMPDAPTETVAQALLRRGVLHQAQGITEAALADCSRVIDMPGAPTEQVTQALLLRGIEYECHDKPEAAKADYERADDLIGTAPEEAGRLLREQAAIGLNRIGTTTAKKKVHRKIGK